MSQTLASGGQSGIGAGPSVLATWGELTMGQTLASGGQSGIGAGPSLSLVGSDGAVDAMVEVDASTLGFGDAATESVKKTTKRTTAKVRDVFMILS